MKTRFGAIGVDSKVRYKDCQEPSPDSVLTSLADWAQEIGKKAGVVSTARVTHATPARYIFLSELPFPTLMILTRLL